MKKRIKTTVVALTAFTLLFTSSMISPVIPQEVKAETVMTQPLRLAGTSRYDTAIQVSQSGWESAEAVVLARGDDFPDALAGVVLTKSVDGPLLLTETAQLTEGVLEEIQRLGATKVYILGSPGAVSEAVENTLEDQELTIERLQGPNRYITASEIAKAAVPQTEKAFLALGTDFPDALSISSYAAAQGIPLLLSEKKVAPEVTLETLQTLGVKEVTLIGGEGVILPEVKSQLEGLGYTVDRLSGTNRYGTNMEILNTLNFDSEAIYVATGTKFPDALAGAALAARNNNPIVLVPQKEIEEEGMSYLGTRRGEGSTFTLLGGWGVISYGMESIIRTGAVNPKISLQYWDGYASYERYLQELSMIPGKATDYVDYVSPNWRHELGIGTDGTLKLVWDKTSSNYKQLTNMAHGLGMKVLPLINGSGATINTILKNPAAREKLIGEIVTLLKDTNTDGVVIDFETPLDYGDAKDPYDGVRNDLTAFMESLYSQLKPMNKIVVMAVMPRASSSQFWLDAYDYEALSHTVDYMHVMTYDHHYRTSAPGPIAPYPWIKQVLTYVKDQGVDMSKVLMGVPYYGRDWVVTGKDANGNPTYNSTAFGYSKALEIADSYGASITYSKYNDTDPVGTPTFKYTDDKGVAHTVFFDDFTSWNAKLAVINEFGLAGVAPWAMGWVDEDTAEGLYPLLNQHLR